MRKKITYCDICETEIRRTYDIDVSVATMTEVDF